MLNLCLSWVRIEGDPFEVSQNHEGRIWFWKPGPVKRRCTPRSTEARDNMGMFEKFDLAPLEEMRNPDVQGHSSTRDGRECHKGNMTFGVAGDDVENE